MKLPGESAAPTITNVPQATAPAPSGALDAAIEILVLYTDGVRQVLDPAGGNAATRRFAQNAVDQTQLAFDNSAVTAQVVMLSAKRVARVDTGDIGADVVYLSADPEAVRLRNAWAADIVLLLSEKGASPVTCGSANTPGYGGAPPPGLGFAGLAVAAVARSCALANFSFAHEFAHIFGANHNPEANTNTTPLRPWAFGHWKTHAEGGARTIMSYPIGEPQCTAPCNRILNYSNGNVYVDWFRTGTPELRENARVLGEFAPATAQYRLGVGRIFADDFQW